MTHAMATHAEDRERRRIERSLARAEAELGASLRALERGVRQAVSPRRVARDHAGWLLVGAFAFGLVLGWRGDEER